MLPRLAGVPLTGTESPAQVARVFEDLLRTVPLAVVAIDREARVTFWNTASERVFGWTESEVLGHPLPFIPETSQDEYRSIRSLAMAGIPSTERHVRRRRKDGVLIDLQISTTPIVDATTGQVAGVVGFYADLTDRVRAEEALREEKEAARRQFLELENIYRNAPVGLCFYTPDLRYVRVNEFLAAINGRPPADHIGKTIHEITPHVARIVEPYYRRVIETREPILNLPVHAAVPADPTNPRDFISSYFPVSDSEDNLVGIAVVVQDVTERAALERERSQLLVRERESRSAAEALVELGKRLSAELDPHRLGLAIVEAARQLTGAQFSAILRGHAPIATSGEMPPDFDGLASSLSASVVSRSGAAAFGTLLLGHSDPNIFSKREQNIVTGIASQAAIAFDNARLFEAAAEANDRLATVLESITEAFVQFDRDWRITYVNQRAAHLARRPKDQLLSRELWTLIPGLASTKSAAELRRAMQDNTPAHFQEYYEPFDLWLQVDAYPTRFGLGCFALDVTRQKRFDEQMRQTQKLESLGVLAGGIAHDFNNLLTGVVGNASLALAILPPDHEAHSSLADVQRAGERAADLVRQLLAYAGQGQFVVESLDLSLLVRQTVALIRSAVSTNIRVIYNLAGGMPFIHADRSQIQQVVMNLVINAAEAIPAGSAGSVTISTRHQEVDRSYLAQTFLSAAIEPGSYVMLEVQDDGAGMDEETVSRIFDPFFTTKFAGRGLGLSAVMGIVRSHHGALKVYSAPGQGTTFKVLFPAVAQTAPAPEPPVRELARGKGTVLFVDDEEIVRSTAEPALRHLGYDVVLAENGLEAVEIVTAQAARLSAVILDRTMPILNGDEAFHRIREIAPRLPILLSSGYNESQSLKANGPSGFIQKPYTVRALAEALKAVLQP